MKEWIILIILLIVGVLAALAMLTIEPHGADIQTDILSIHVSERFPHSGHTPSYIVTDTNVMYEVGFTTDFLYLQPGYNYTIEKQQFTAKSMRSRITNGTITKIISKDILVSS